MPFLIDLVKDFRFATFGYPVLRSWNRAFCNVLPNWYTKDSLVLWQALFLNLPIWIDLHVVVNDSEVCMSQRNKTIQVDKDLLGILASKEFDNFTVLELRDAYVSLPAHEALNKTKAQRVVYRLIYRLKNEGLLKPHGKEARRRRYTKTDEFHETIFTTYPEKTSPTPITIPDPSNVEKGNTTISSLLEKLKRYKKELLISMGESDEYELLYVEFPHLKSGLQASYNEARDRCDKLLGHVKAIEITIDRQKGKERDGSSKVAI